MLLVCQIICGSQLRDNTNVGHKFLIKKKVGFNLRTNEEFIVNLRQINQSYYREGSDEGKS